VTPGRARLFVVVLPAALYFFSYFHRVAPAVVAADLMRAFGITAASLALLAAVYPYVFAAMALLAGSLADGVGPRWTLAAGGVAMAVGTALFGAGADVRRRSRRTPRHGRRRLGDTDRMAQSDRRVVPRG
jgi:sugar phosphate permease